MTTGTEVARYEAPENGAGVALAPREQVAGLMRPVAPPAEVIAAQEATRELIEQALKPGRDYGVVPGTEKPSLLKPGGERITAAMGCYPRYRIIEKEIDHDRENHYEKVKWVTVGKEKPANWEQLKAAGVGRNRKYDDGWVWQEKQVEPGVSNGLYRYVVDCELVHRGSGIVIGHGIGSCSTMESKYIDRPRDLENTVLKMAEKRAFIAAVLNTFGLSDQFTQDIEDNPQAFGIDAEAEGNAGRPAARNGAAGEPEARCPKCGGPMWDNRQRKKQGKTNPNAPDFKCKDKGCGGVYWPGQWPPPPPATEDEAAYLFDVVQALTELADDLGRAEKNKVRKAWNLVHPDAVAANGLPSAKDVAVLTDELRGILTNYAPDHQLAFTPEEETGAADRARENVANPPPEDAQRALGREIAERVNSAPPLGAPSEQVAAAVGPGRDARTAAPDNNDDDLPF